MGTDFVPSGRFGVLRLKGSTSNGNEDAGSAQGKAWGDFCPRGCGLTGLQFPLDDTGLARLAACCTHLARWHGLRDRAPAGSLLNDKVRIEIVPVAATEKVVPADRAPIALSDGIVALQYDGGKGPRVQIRLRNDSNVRLYVALLDLTNSFKCSKWFGEWIPAGGTGYAYGRKVIQMKVADWREPAVRSVTDYLKAVVSIVDFDPERWNLPALLPYVPTRDVEPDGDDEEPQALWGTTLLKVVTTR